jgi:hypothetical protein
MPTDSVARRADLRGPESETISKITAHALHTD